jgi:hypothetical protein
MDSLSSELVLEILKFVERDIRDIPPLLRVNHQWFYCGISILWAYGRWWSLARVPKNRQQIYASVIKSLLLNAKSRENLEALSHLTFPKLTRLSIDFEPDRVPNNQIRIRASLRPVAPLNLSYIKHYLRAELEMIRLNGNFDPELLGYIHRYCPRLQCLSIGSMGRRFTPEIFLKFLQAKPSLSDIWISSREEDEFLTGDILNHLAERKNLRALSLDHTISASLVENLNKSPAFVALRQLCIEVTEGALPLLVDATKSVQNLRLTLKANDGDLLGEIDSATFRHISKLTELRQLNLFVWGDMRKIRNEDILHLKSLTQLTALKISGSSATSLCASNFTDDEFETLFASFAGLEDLTLQLYISKLTPEALVVLGKHCPSLEHCDFMGTFDTTVFKTEKAPLFPSLKWLNIGELSNIESKIRYT